jgi:hypothetical protein
MENTLGKQPESFRANGRWSLALPVGLALLAALAVWMITSRYIVPGGRPAFSPLDMPQSAFTEATGVRVTRVAVTAGGGMVDLRYQVIDPDKATVVHDRNRPPAIVDAATGQVVNRPWMQHSHASALRAGVTYYLILVNPGGVIKPGNTVSVVIGDARLEHVPVQ